MRSGPRTWCGASSVRPRRTGSGSRTSLTSRPGRAWSTSRSSSTRTHGGSWGGAPPGPCRPPWRTAEQVELATLEYVDWFNHRRLYEACGDIPPAELEAAYYSQNAVLAEA